MSRRFILDSDPVTGQFSTFEYDAAEDMYLIQQGQVLDNIIEANKRDYTADHAQHKEGLGRQVASIPLNIWMDLYKQGITRDKKAFRRWLNDADNRHFRTAPGRV